MISQNLFYVILYWKFINFYVTTNLILCHDKLYVMNYIYKSYVFMSS